MNAMPTAPQYLVEAGLPARDRDTVLAIVNTLGTATNRAIHRYLNQKKVPQR